ncbi:hypothetical protein [Halostreptopolyspora alba]|uniref:hypothetical protein n=1 Tax=Halostreptopolyspora alba TaxID=2487137 RepID=UPI0011CE9A28
MIKTPGDVLMNMSKLRTGMHRDDVGTWFSAVYEVRRPGNFSIEYNYDDEPSLNFPLVNSQFAVELQRFPRSPEATPEWLREKADAAAAGDE